MIHAAMESTGVYWKPVFNFLESGCQLILVNARHIKQLPGRKTDMADCASIASPLRHGFLEACFVSEVEVRQLRDLCRMRTTLVREPQPPNFVVGSRCILILLMRSATLRPSRPQSISARWVA